MMPDGNVKVDKPDGKGLLDRPAFSFRLQIILGFFTFFILSVVVTIGAMITINQIEQKITTVQRWELFLFNIEQARRWEKNYFLYGTNLEDALLSTEDAKAILDADVKKFVQVEVPLQKKTIKNHLDMYQKSLLELRQLARENPGNMPRADEIESSLRHFGSRIVDEAADLAAREHDLMFRWLRLVQQIPVYFLFFLFFLVIYMTRFLSIRFMKPLKYLINETRRIAKGDFAPVKPLRKYRDEFTTVEVAINRMLRELETRQSSLIESHKLRAVGILTAGVAHELNNPINNIMLTAHAMLEEYDDLSKPEHLGMINDIIGETDRSRSIVHNLLDFTRENKSTFNAIDIGALVDETTKLAKNQAKVRGVPIRLDIQPGLPPVLGDRQKLKQVFLNLVLNALDAVEKNGLIQIRVRYYKLNYLSVQVEDNGVGIEPDSLPYIFDPFFTTKSVGKGTGLGLSVSHGIVSKHKGRIEAESRPGEYTIFTVILPYYPGSGDLSASKNDLGVSD
jgi:two-component system, NtrC family, sensor kinase